MNLGLSLYLDLLRALAAIAVYVFHAQYFSGKAFPLVGQLGSEAVIVFFVLSGLLISYARGKHVGIQDFMISRLGRLWSVGLPALALTLAADNLGQYLSLAAYSPMQPYGLFKWIGSLTINAMFLNQVWTFSIFPGTNGPFWSLSYEFWYYAAFAAAVFFRGWIRIGSVCLVSIIAGPKIMVGFPIWMMGAGIYSVLMHFKRCNSIFGFLIWLGSIVVALAFWHFQIHDWLITQFPSVAELAAKEWSVNFWPASYSIGAIVALNIYGFACVAHHFEPLLTRVSLIIKTTANISFGLYLFHYPLMYLVKAILWAGGIHDGIMFVASIYLLPFVVSAYIALICERKKSYFPNALRVSLAKINIAARRFQRKRGQIPSTGRD